MDDEAFRWIDLLGKLLISWPAVGLIAILAFRKQIVEVLGQFGRKDLTKAKLGPVEIERQLHEVAVKGEQAVGRLDQLNQLMAESRLLELEVTEERFGIGFTEEQRKRMRQQIADFRALTTSARGEDKTVKQQPAEDR